MFSMTRKFMFVIVNNLAASAIEVHVLKILFNQCSSKTVPELEILGFH